MPVEILIDADLTSRAEKLADERGTTKEVIVEKALRRYLTIHKQFTDTERLKKEK